jgi:hypothetical protein
MISAQNKQNYFYFFTDSNPHNTPLIMEEAQLFWSAVLKMQERNIYADSDCIQCFQLWYYFNSYIVQKTSFVYKIEEKTAHDESLHALVSEKVGIC